MRKGFEEEVIRNLLQQWEKLKNELAEVFEKREHKKALKPMLEGIQLFYEFLQLSNDIEGPLKDEDFSILNLSLKPVNLQERLDFINSRPNLYHSFIQLSELMNEQEKHYYKNLTIKKGTKQ